MQARREMELTLASLGKYAQSLSVADGLLRDGAPFEDLYFQKGYALMKMGREEDARRAYEESVRKNPGFPEAYFHLGLLQMKSRRWPQAAVFFEKAFDIKPEPRYSEMLEKARSAGSSQ